MAKKLTVKGVEAAKADPLKRLEIPDAQLPGFYLVIQPSGSKSWALRYRSGGKPKKLTIGPVLIERVGVSDAKPPLGAAMTLAEARIAAQDALQLIAQGLDPADVKKAAKAPPADPELELVKRHGQTFIDRACKPKNRSWEEVQRQFDKTIFPALGERDIRSVGKRDIIELLDGLVDRGAPVMANRVFATLRRFFNWLVGRGVIDVSPCLGLKMPSAEQSRDRALGHDEIAALWKATVSFAHPFGPFFRMLLLTAQRREEVAGMVRSEINTDQAEWIIPAARAKNSKAHTVPLSAEALATLKTLASVGSKGLVFTTTGKTPVSGFSKAKARLDSSLGFENPFTLHDLRRTAASGMAELGEPIHVVEAVLNHVSGTIRGVAAVYNRHDYAEEKRLALMAWGRFVEFLADDGLRSRYAALKDRRPFREAIHADDPTWTAFVERLKNGSDNVVRLVEAEAAA